MSPESSEQQGNRHLLFKYAREVWTNLPDFIREYALFVEMHIKSLRSQAIPCEYLSGNKGDVILLPGYGERWPFMVKIAEYFRNQGFRIHILDKLERTRNLGRIEDYVTELKAFLEGEEINIQNCIIITHSKGGLIAMQYLIQSLEQNPEAQSPLIVNIAVPFRGTLLGFLDRLIFNLTHGYELLPGSKVINAIQKGIVEFQERLKETTISFQAGKGDNHIIPSGNASLPQLEDRNVAVDIYGHTRILFSDTLLNLLGQILKEKGFQF